MPTVLLSTHDKTGLVPFAQNLVSLGWRLLASGGTARLLRQNDLPVIEVAEYTGSPEILGGRVKTLHPAIYGGLLARATEEDRRELQILGWDYIDMVVVNLYPFEDTVASPTVTPQEIIENIDIGGVTLIRAAAKNHERVLLICDPADYSRVLQRLERGVVDAEFRRKLAMKGFSHTAHYDDAITRYFFGEDAMCLNLYPVQKLRYGENPHQNAMLYSFDPGEGPLGGKVLQGKELSYNNLLDLDAAWRGVVSFTDPAAVIVKHLSPCGIASADTLVSAYRNALASDLISAFGGIVALNRPVDAETAMAMKELYLECIIAPGFTPESLTLLASKRNCRLIDMPDLLVEPAYELRSVVGGLLKQALDFGDPQGTEWKVVSARQPTEEEWVALRFAWKACQHVKSNAIVFAKGTATVGIGGGQPNRVDSVRIAALRAGTRAHGAVMASDAFFPFPDSITVAAESGVTAVIHPGGSVRDTESIAAADAAGMAMVTTGVRHFRH